MNVTDPQLDLISKVLSAAAVRHRVVGQNLANANTPGYHAQEVAFDDHLQEQISSGDVDVSDLEPEVRHTAGLKERSDGNNVDVAMETGQLERNALVYSAFSNVLGQKLSMLRTAITGR